MKNQEFEATLLELNISKREFSELTGLPYQTIMNWKRFDTLPIWVESWLENYVKAKGLDNIVNAVKPFIKE